MRVTDQTVNKLPTPALLTESERQKKRAEDRILQLDEEYKKTCQTLQENIHTQLPLQFDGFWFKEAQFETQVQEVQDEETYHNVFEANYKHQVNTIVYWWRYKLRKMNDK